ncbi:MAG: hypothetical protein MJZ19_06770 [Paludibacteraceae bacterium]|nr:hypothetical protein [Paludibacteraceae bacterium]
MRMRLAGLYKQIPLLVCALLFAFSSGAKAKSVADFEMYIYSFQILPFNMSALLARSVIGAEFMLAVSLLFPLKLGKVKVAEDLSLAMLAAFSIFLIVLVMNGDEGNCHCMGVVFDLNPVESLIKNVVVAALLLLGRKFAWHKESSVKLGVIVTVVLFVLAQIVIFLWKPADFMKEYKDQKVRAMVLREYLSDNAPVSFAKDGRRMIAVYTTECPTCKRGAKKINAMMEKNPIDSTKFLKMIKINESIESVEALADLDSFLVKTNTSAYNVLIVNGDTLSKISPKAPTFIFMDGDSVLFSRGYKSLMESDLDYLK